MLQGIQGICSAHFEGGLGSTKLNPIPTMFSFPTHMQPKSQHERVDPEERRQRSMNCLLMGTEAVSKGKVRKTNKGKKE